jgi:hypothetical protein
MLSVPSEDCTGKAMFSILLQGLAGIDNTQYAENESIN